jgi:peptidoglycan biosynthesis protein MviN/MurJ (putative lipid II flippase)
MWIALVSFGLMIGLAYPLAATFSVAGLALAFVIGSTVQATLLYLGLRRSAPAITRAEPALVTFVLKVLVAVGVMVGVVQLAKVLVVLAGAPMDRYIGVLTQAVVAALAGAGSYLLLIDLFALTELRQVWSIVASRFTGRLGRGHVDQPR